MLGTSRRLRASEVREVIKDGRTLRQGAISAKVLPSSGISRAAAVVSKAFAKTAVERNRLRRALYRTLETTLPKKGSLIVFFVKEKDTKQLRMDTTLLCSKLI